ncbi:phage minor head protein [Desulfovibrio sp. ZJ200]|uniref:phage minor head protein n=1 Tax=Desulfovibrio sp. ZJ200 TaxID=2709792 RepID=UPI0013EACCE2|nr:phage minor head protein [Desulfovibrio sp. ZJ200]
MAKKKPDFTLDDPEIIAEPVQPDAAIKFWQERAKLTWDQAKGLADGAKARAFYVTGLYQQDLVKLVSDGIEAALANGETLPQFRERILAAIQTQGWHGHRVENIFRTNMQSAYAAGRYKKMQAVKNSRPYWQYMAVMDKRVRPSHAILHGKVYPAEHEFWDSHYPPNGFRCRCGVVTLSERQVKKQGLTVEKEMPKADMWTDPKTKMEYFVNFPGADSGFRNNPFKEWAKNGGVADLPGLKDFPPPKKAPVTQKLLQAEISALDEQIKTTTDKAVKEALEAKKAEQQALLEKKATTALKNKLNAESKKLHVKLNAFPIKTYSGIWQSDITTAEWSKKAASIQAKKDYYLFKLATGGLTPQDVTKFQGFLKDLDEFSEKGQEYYNLQQSLKNNQASLLSLKKGGKVTAKTGKTADDPYSQERKDAAIWAKTRKEADAVLRQKCGEVWQKAKTVERNAAYKYTSGSGSFNRPLRGHDKDWGNFKGVGKVNLNNEGSGDAIKHLTNLINRSSYDRDIWVQRGVKPSGAAAFLGISEKQLKGMSQDKLFDLLKKDAVTDTAFVSCGSCKGTGFPGVIFNIYCPKGTKMLYAEPFSAYGYGAKKNWDGISGQSSFGGELETIIQRGTKFRVTKVEKSSKGIFIDMEVVEQIEV